MTNKFNQITKNTTFSNFCKTNNISPIEQDTVLHTPKKSNKVIAYSTQPPEVQEVFFDFDNNSSPPNTYCKDGQRQIIKLMRQGKYKIAATIDLHNCTQTTALTQLEKLVNTSNTHGNSCLEIIHGKGLNSPSQTSVLKLLVRKFLMEHPRLVAYTKADTKCGGDGVTLVKLKTKK